MSFRPIGELVQDVLLNSRTMGSREPYFPDMPENWFNEKLQSCSAARRCANENNRPHHVNE